MTETLGSIYLLPPSPWSHRVILVQRYLRCGAVQVKEYSPFLTGLWLNLTGRLKRGAKVTAPLLLPAHGGAPLMDSHGIARLLDERRAPDTPTLFPTEHDGVIRQLVEAAEVVSAHSRGVGMQDFIDHPQEAAQFLFPPFFAKLPLFRHIAVFIIRQVASKYSAESTAANEESMRQAMEVIETAVHRAEGGLHLVGDSLTYADFVVVCSLSNIVHNPHLEKVGIRTNKAETERYPEVKAWGEAFIAKFVRDEEMEWPLPRYNAHGVPM